MQAEDTAGTRASRIGDFVRLAFGAGDWKSYAGRLSRKYSGLRLVLRAEQGTGQRRQATVVRSILGGGTSTVEPTLGFNIRTLPYKG